MMTTLQSRHGGFFNHQIPLTDDDLRRHAPVIFEGGNSERCSGRYVHVGTDRIIGGLREAGWLPVAAEEQRTRSEDRLGYQKHMVSFRRAEQMQTLDEWNIELVLINSHDGGCAYTLHAGIYRRICSNGLVVSDGGFEALRFRHAGLDPDEVVTGSLGLVDGIPALNEKIDGFKGKTTTPAEQQELARRGLELRYDDGPAPITVDQVLTPRRMADGGSDLWSVFNRVQENLIKGGQRGGYERNDGERGVLRRVRSKPLRGIDSRVDLNKGLWSIAEGVLAGLYN